MLPAGLLLRLFRPHWNYTVILDDHTAGKIGNEQVRLIEVEPGEHRLYMRFVGLRRSAELRLYLEQDEERDFLCGTSGFGWPTLWQASPEDLAQIRGAPTGQPPKPADPVPPD